MLYNAHHEQDAALTDSGTTLAPHAYLVLYLVTAVREHVWPVSGYYYRQSSRSLIV